MRKSTRITKNKLFNYSTQNKKPQQNKLKKNKKKNKKKISQTKNKKQKKNRTTQSNGTSTIRHHAQNNYVS